MTKINDPANLNGKLFGYKIKYNEVEGLEIPNTGFSTLKVKPKYNGNIAEVDWKSGTVTGDNLRRYCYVYDNLNRLSAGFYQKDTNPSAKEYFEKMDYDLNGNITNLKRSGALEGPVATNIDDLAYVYTGNRLTSVTDSSTDYRGYPDVSGNEISYDANGNMISHQDKGILQIQYNYLNLPNFLKFSQTYIPRVTSRPVNIRSFYQYNASGEKLRKIYLHKNPFGSGEESVTTDYLDGFQYESKQVSSNTPVVALKFVPTAEGYYNFENNKYIYNYTDHLGNVRLSYFKNGTSAEVLEQNNYYPFGLEHEGYNALAGNPAYKYSYNGKELQTESGMYDYGARMYMADIGRWGVVDPLAEKMTRHSPYNYAFNNPIRFIDPDGMENKDIIKIMNDGTIKRTADTNPYDTITNEDGSSSIQIARTNVTDANPRGDSQISETKDSSIELEVDGISRNKFSYFQINDYNVATQVFEFIADNTSVEFGQNRFDFSDGFSTNIISTIYDPTTNLNPKDALGFENLTPFLQSKHFINKSIHFESVHSHPGFEYNPSGFSEGDWNNGNPTFNVAYKNSGDKKSSINNPALSKYVYNSWLKKNGANGGYVKYDYNQATYTGKKK